MALIFIYNAQPVLLFLCHNYKQVILTDIQLYFYRSINSINVEDARNEMYIKTINDLNPGVNLLEQR